MLACLASSSEDTTTSRRACKTERKVFCASTNLFPDTNRYPSASSERIDCSDRTDTGSTRPGDDSLGLRRTWSFSGGSEANGDK